MNHTRTSKTLASMIAALAITVSTGAVFAQDEPARVTVADVNAGTVAGTVTIDGAILGQQAGDEYLFSDGTDVVTIDLDTGNPANAEVPTLTLMNIVGTVASHEIDVSSWAPLDIFVAAVIRTPEEAIDAFQGWMITQNGQAPASADDQAEGPADGTVLSDD